MSAAVIGERGSNREESRRQIQGMRPIAWAKAGRALCGRENISLSDGIVDEISNMLRFRPP
jgi:hypothetical protein